MRDRHPPQSLAILWFPFPLLSSWWGSWGPHTHRVLVAFRSHPVVGFWLLALQFSMLLTAPPKLGLLFIQFMSMSGSVPGSVLALGIQWWQHSMASTLGGSQCSRNHTRTNSYGSGMCYDPGTQGLEGSHSRGPDWSIQWGKCVDIMRSQVDSEGERH